MTRIFWLAVLFAAGCASAPSKNIRVRYNPDDYKDVVAQYTEEKEHFDGLNMVFKTHATFLGEKLQGMILNKHATDFQWSDRQYEDERNKSNESMARESHFFLSFFVPKRKLDDLNSSASVWRIFLDTNGHRYAGQINKYPGVVDTVATDFPHHTRWATAYVATFSLPTSEVTANGGTIVVTGPLGEEELVFPNLD